MVVNGTRTDDKLPTICADEECGDSCGTVFAVTTPTVITTITRLWSSGRWTKSSMTTDTTRHRSQ